MNGGARIGPLGGLGAAGAVALALLAFACGDDAAARADAAAPSGANAAPDGGPGPVGPAPSNAPPPLGTGLGVHPSDDTSVTRGGTMTFTNVGAPGSWPRRIDRERGDSACNYKDGNDTWGGHCCQKEQRTESTRLAPFDAEMTLIMKAITVKQIAVYQPTSDTSPWSLVSAWDDRSHTGQNLMLTQKQTPEAMLSGTLSRSDCVHYLAQSSTFACGDGQDYFCPKDPGVLQLGWSGSKLFVFLASMTFDDAQVKACNGSGTGHPGPWVALVASELIRDGARKWNGACNCYSKTGSVGDGCGEINLFEVVMDDNAYSNREFISTGVRSYQAGHVGGNVCGSGCSRDAFADDVDVLDACSKKAYSTGPEIAVGGKSDGCPVWRRPVGDRYFVVLLDEPTRTIQVAIVHPKKIPNGIASLVPALPASITRAGIDALVALRLPAPD